MAWSVLDPTNDSLLINAPGVIRANWDAIALGTDAALQITNAKVANSAAIVESKLLFSGSGHGHTGGTDGKQIVLSTGTSGVLATSRGGTGSSAVANSAGGLVILNASGYLPALNASLLTGLTAAQIPSLDASKITTGYLGTARLGSGSASTSTYLRGDSTWAPVVAITAVADTDAGTSINVPHVETAFLSVAKTITSGNTVLLIASGASGGSYTQYRTSFTIRLKQGSTVVQSINIALWATGSSDNWALSGIVTGLSGSVTFSVTMQQVGGDTAVTSNGNLSVLEF